MLQRFERRIESLVNRPFARAFKAEVQPVEVASALQRECDDRAAIVGRGRTMVPNSFVVELGARDHARLAPYAGPLGAELADMVREHAQEQQYSFLGPVEVVLEEVDDLETGIFRVRSSAVAGREAVAPVAAPAPPRPPEPAPQAAAPPAPLPGRAPASAATRVTPRPAPAAPMPWLDVAGTKVVLRAQRTVIGRGLDADLRLDDPGVSRRHAEVRVQGAHGVVSDLGSTNGVVVGGERVDEALLEDGTRFELGSTSIVFHAPDAGDGRAGA
nr:DUF3662 and FHA domain-containing protein [Vallicoccus soli]